MVFPSRDSLDALQYYLYLRTEQSVAQTKCRYLDTLRLVSGFRRAQKPPLDAME